MGGLKSHPTPHLYHNTEYTVLNTRVNSHTYTKLHSLVNKYTRILTHTFCQQMHNHDRYARNKDIHSTFFFVRAKPYIAVTHTRLITRLFEIQANKRFSVSHTYTQRHAYTLVRLSDQSSTQ